MLICKYIEVQVVPGNIEIFLSLFQVPKHDNSRLKNLRLDKF
jgi:hypothetical protein